MPAGTHEEPAGQTAARQSPLLDTDHRKPRDEDRKPRPNNPRTAVRINTANQPTITVTTARPVSKSRAWRTAITPATSIQIHTTKATIPPRQGINPRIWSTPGL